MAATALSTDEYIHKIEKCEARFEILTQNPELFLGNRLKTATGLLKIAKRVYDLYKKNDSDKKSLPRLMIDGFDDEQIWQQIEIDNSSCKNRLIKHVAELATRKTRKIPIKTSLNDRKKKKADNQQDEDEIESDEESLPQHEEEEEIEKKRKKIPRKAIKKSRVDDTFFKLSEMEQYLEAEESKIESGMRASDDESIDYFEGIPSSDEDADSDDDVKKKQYKYDEFFDPITQDGAYEEMECEDEISEIDNDTFEENEDGMDEMKSSIEIRQEKLKEKIKDLEERNLAPKPWQLMGEVSASTRPENSLLQQHAMFDHVQRQAPVITEETTLKLEDIIKQRIKDQAWNDVERKVKPKEEPFEYKKRIVLDQEKSKLSLAQIYENEYLKLQETEKTEEESPEHVLIKKMMKSLFYKLDTLCNFHFTPKPVMPELKIVNNLPAIVMEEVAPTAASLGSLLAPKEIMAPSEEKGVREKGKTDKLRERRLKKQFQSSRRKEREEREKAASSDLNPKKNKYNKDKLLKTLVKNVEKAEMKERKTHLKSKDTFKRLNEISKQKKITNK